ncbi:hypothetical protein [Marivita geojedonensis]|uniref:Tetratricopeptide repeat-like domain-containing protein n=1 Tax=Marivita geojedonensis TaxID=1123756 RepID=A0A1X4NIR3_9RHOB|nr:hypothetical protein [Marivita geojedonensis]OSQ48959.1 hypothetical protein MGEO_14110 [Marivita geojedonensis]PRY75355.1 hypothetical protein CLV76_11545 [Marivita geojedonensis]
MSETDSFIEEVTEEVRRDRLFALMRRYGWIAVLAVLLLVGGTAYREYTRAAEQAKAQAFGDAILAALESDEASDRVAALDQIEAPTEEGAAVLDMLIAAEDALAGNGAAAAERLNATATDGDLPEIYRQIASFKALTRPESTLSADERRVAFEAMAAPGAPLRLLAEEQLALLDIEAGDTDAALTRLNAILGDSELTAGLRRRASQLIVALGGEIEAS